MNISLDQAIHNLAFAYGKSTTTGCIRQSPEDFQVTEIPLVEPTGEGEHVWLYVRKRATNTAWVAKQLARVAGVRERDVSYAGLKDRHAVTEQWFSVHLPGQIDPDWSEIDSDGIQVLKHVRHSRKLRRGALQGNVFRIVIRELVADMGQLEQRLEQIAAGGVPNYFGEQRFGIEGRNLSLADKLFNGERLKLKRPVRGLVLSAARSFLFNQVLSERITGSSWNKALPGDVLQLDGTHSIFVVEAIDDEIEQRILSADLHPTGPLAGEGGKLPNDHAGSIETAVLDQYSAWCEGLVKARLKADRRSLRLMVKEFTWEKNSDDNLILKFRLRPGAYATSVLREILRVS